jgi:hypothetical protein
MTESKPSKIRPIWSPCSRPGCPDDFRQLGDCLLWVVLQILAEIAQIIRLLFNGKSYALIFTREGLVYILGDFFHRRTRSPCSRHKHRGPRRIFAALISSHYSVALVRDSFASKLQVWRVLHCPACTPCFARACNFRPQIRKLVSRENRFFRSLYIRSRLSDVLGPGLPDFSW